MNVILHLFIFHLRIICFLVQDNLSRGNMGAVKILQGLYPEPGRLQFIYADLGNAKVVCFLSLTLSLISLFIS